MSLVGQQELQLDPAPPADDDKAERIASATRVSQLAGEEGRTRYYGRGKRGVPKTSARDSADFLDAAKELVKAAEQLGEWHAAKLDMRPIARRNAEMSALSHARLAVGFIEEVLLRHRYDVRNAESSTEE